MRIASIPLDEELRLQDLYSYDILDSERDRDFDELLEVAAHIYGCPVAAITFIDKDRQWFKSKIGMDGAAEQTSRDVAFCAHTILDNKVFVVPDASSDERFHDNPLVTDGLRVRFYAGAPIVSMGGYRLGSMCIIDQVPRELSVQEANMLEILSRQVSKLLELRMKNNLLRKQAMEQLRLEKQMLRKTLQEAEAEKKTIAEELHENIAQSLAASKFQLEMAEVGGFGTRDLIAKSKENISRVIHQIQELSHSISPSILFRMIELKPFLTDLFRKFEARTGIRVRFVMEGKRSVPSETALVIYRVVEAQLQNVKSHAKATRVTVNLHHFSMIHLTIKDDGIGFDTGSFQRGSGLTKILSGVEAMNGKVEVSSEINGGCALTVTIPSGAAASVQA